MNSTQNQTQFHWPILLFYFFFFLFKSFRWLLGSHNTLLSFPPSSSSHYRPFTFPLFNKNKIFKLKQVLERKKTTQSLNSTLFFFFFSPLCFTLLLLVCYIWSVMDYIELSASSSYQDYLKALEVDIQHANMLWVHSLFLFIYFFNYDFRIFLMLNGYLNLIGFFGNFVLVMFNGGFLNWKGLL